MTGRHRLASRHDDVVVVQRASQLVADLGAELDVRLEKERRPAERMRMLRETTYRITRAANDAVTAYSRTRRLLRDELARPDADVQAVELISDRLGTARAELLNALEVAGRRYPTTETAPTPSPLAGGEEVACEVETGPKGARAIGARPA